MHLIVRETNDSIAHLIQRRCSLRILLLPASMYIAINLNDQSPCDTTEIDDVIANRMLTPKLQFIELMCA